MVSMGSLHFFRWTEQLKASGHDIYWFDILDGSVESPRLVWANQLVNWNRKFNYPGRYFLKKNIPNLYGFIEKINSNETSMVFENYFNKVKPDVVHSFVMYMSCYPILNVMKKNPSVKWIYSAWGNDLFYYQKDSVRLKEIKNTLLELDYMFADCKRDFEIA